MSDLACAATLVLARHGDAGYVETWFSDEGGSLTRAGRDQAAGLADALADRKVAHVWCSDSSRAVQTAEIAAARLDVAVTAVPGLREADIGDLRGQEFSLDPLRAVTDRWFAGDLDAGFAGGETGAEVVARCASVLGEVADRHRGETVLVVGHQHALGITLPSLAPQVSTGWVERHLLDNGESAEVLADADAWRLVRWGTHRF